MKNKKVILFLPAFFWMVVIVVLSGYPGNQLPKTTLWQFDKLVHTLIYAILAMLLFFPFIQQFLKKEQQLKIRFNIIFFSIAFGGFMEILQAYIFINRSGSWMDFFANAVGAILGVLLVPLVLKFLPINK